MNWIKYFFANKATKRQDLVAGVSCPLKLLEVFNLKNKTVKKLQIIFDANELCVVEATCYITKSELDEFVEEISKYHFDVSYKTNG